MPWAMLLLDCLGSIPYAMLILPADCTTLGAIDNLPLPPITLCLNCELLFEDFELAVKHFFAVLLNQLFFVLCRLAL